MLFPGLIICTFKKLCVSKEGGVQEEIAWVYYREEQYFVYVSIRSPSHFAPFFSEAASALLNTHTQIIVIIV